jgi:hypothetical protein
VVKSPVQSGLLPSKWSNRDCNRSQLIQKIKKPDQDHYGPVLISPVAKIDQSATSLLKDWLKPVATSFFPVATAYYTHYSVTVDDQKRFCIILTSNS